MSYYIFQPFHIRELTQIKWNLHMKNSMLPCLLHPNLQELTYGLSINRWHLEYMPYGTLLSHKTEWVSVSLKGCNLKPSRQSVNTRFSFFWSVTIYSENEKCVQMKWRFCGMILFFSPCLYSWWAVIFQLFVEYQHQWWITTAEKGWREAGDRRRVREVWLPFGIELLRW